MKPRTNKRRSHGKPRHAATYAPAPRSSSQHARKSPLAGVLLVMLAGLLFVGTLVGLGQCTAPESAPKNAEYVSPYDWSSLERTGDRLAYRPGGSLKSQVGVDVSDHQGFIDWNAVAADGIDFAFVRIGNRGYTQGGLSADARFDENVRGAQAAGLQTGAYFFSQAVNTAEAVEEAEFVLAQLNGRALELPVAFDHEPVADPNGRANNLDKGTLTAAAIAFCERLEAAGYKTMIYGNNGDMARYDRTALGNRPVWFAEYDAPVPRARFDFALWQYTNGGTVAGISTSVDLNLRMTEAL